MNTLIKMTPEFPWPDTLFSNIVEHPEAIAQRIARFAGVVGKENVIAGAGCGFASFASTCEVHPSVVWVKLKALAGGARIASKALWR